MKLTRQIRVSEEELDLLAVLRMYEIKPSLVARILIPVVKSEEVKARLQDIIERYEIITIS